MKIVDLSTYIEDTPSEPMKVKVKTRPHSGGNKFGRKLVFLERLVLGKELKK